MERRICQYCKGKMLLERKKKSALSTNKSTYQLRCLNCGYLFDFNSKLDEVDNKSNDFDSELDNSDKKPKNKRIKKVITYGLGVAGYVVLRRLLGL